MNAANTTPDYPAMKLLDYFEAVYLPARALDDIAAVTVYQTRMACKWLIGFLQREVLQPGQHALIAPCRLALTSASR